MNGNTREVRLVFGEILQKTKRLNVVKRKVGKKKNENSLTIRNLS